MLHYQQTHRERIMARGLNKVLLIGTLGDEPTIRTTPSGKNVATLSIVTNEARRNVDTGEIIETSEWHHIVMWNKLAETANKYLHKGSLIYVEGKLRTRSYDKNGQKHYVTEVVADDMQMLGGKSNSGIADRSPNTYQKAQTPKAIEPAAVNDTFDPSEIPF